MYNTPVKNTIETANTTNWTGSSSTSSIRNTPDKFKENTTLKKADNRIKKHCGKCQFKYLYDPARDYPQNCPNCGGGGSSHIVTKPVRR
jgi:transcription initiation factor IIE alpha subunit